MTERDLEIFMAVARCGNMTGAAKELFISQPSVSQAIASIEKEYGILLFERFKKKLYLTNVGKTLHSYLNRFFSVKKDIQDYLSFASHETMLRVGATVTVGTCVICPILNSVKEIIPDLDMKVTISNTHILEEKLLANEIDISLVEGIASSPELLSSCVIPDALVLIVPPEHRFFGRQDVTLEEIAEEPLILRESGSGTRALFETQMLRSGIHPNIRWDCCNTDAIKTAVISGMGISVISKRLVEKELANGSLWACGIRDVELNRFFSIVYHRDKYMTKQMEVFIRACRDFK